MPSECSHSETDLEGGSDYGLSVETFPSTTGSEIGGLHFLCFP